MKKCFVLLLLVTVLLNKNFTVYAFDGDTKNSYVVYTADGNYLFEKSDVKLFDNYISKNFDMFEIVEVNEQTKQAVAKFIRKIDKPKVDINTQPSQISSVDKKICLYLTHNDESFVPTDGVDSVYGAGGIHDVAKMFKRELELFGISVELDETLHIPHNSSAYSRSGVTANNLYKKYSPDAMFDVHRDGVSRSYYATKVDGEEYSKIRIVVGQANENKDENLEFALYLMSVAEEKYPWLFTDIYFAKGHYNQAITNKLLLFEMGTYLIEKELVLKSVKPLADVVNTALFNTTVNEEDNNIIVGGTPTVSTPTVNEYLNNLQEEHSETNLNGYKFIIFVVASISVGLSLFIVYYANRQKFLNKAKTTKNK